MIISFAWTTDALLAGRKTCTRRDWNKEYAAKFRQDAVADAYDRLPRVHGKPVGKVQILKPPYPEATRDIPECDFENEGLKFMEEKGLLIRGITPRKWFDNWRESDQVLFVVRFRLVFKCDRCGKWTSLAAFADRRRLCPLCSVDWQYFAEDHSMKARESLAGFNETYQAFLKTPVLGDFKGARYEQGKATPRRKDPGQIEESGSSAFPVSVPELRPDVHEGGRATERMSISSSNDFGHSVHT